MTHSGPRTVVLGFDALSMDYLDTFDLPNFDALRDRGVTAPLEATFPPWTGSAWPSMYTGVAPGSHGVYSFFDFETGYPDDAALVTREDVQAPALWEYLTDRGKSAAVLNVPLTHPAAAIEGVLVPGYLAPEDAAGTPPGIRDELSTALDEEYRIYAAEETGEADAAMLETYLSLIDLRGRAARHLIEQRHPDVAMVQVQKTDTVFHQFDDRDAFRRVYEAADSVVRTVLESVPDDANVIVCSDHGIGPTRGYNIYVNEILREAGFVEATRDGETPTLSDSKHHLAGDAEDSNDDGGAVSATVSGLTTALSRIGVQPGDVYAMARRVGVDGVLRRVLPADAAGSIARHVDWAASTAYCRSGPELGVRVNLAGREPEGTVPPDQYEAVRDRLLETLSAVETPDEEPAFEWVRRREEVYEGPETAAACDVLFKPANMNHVVATNLLGKRFVPIDKYNHKQDGVFVGAGPAFDATAAVDRLSLTDVAPTVMALADAPVPSRMTGSVPAALLTVEWTADSYEGLDAGGGATPAGDTDAVEARLADLGYL